MSGTKFTKGKWELRSQFQIVIGGGLTTTQMTGDNFVSVAEREANAHLIASAPDMYAMLDVLSTDLQVMFGERSDPITSDINKLLAKARGESCNNK